MFSFTSTDAISYHKYKYDRTGTLVMHTIRLTLIKGEMHALQPWSMGAIVAYQQVHTHRMLVILVITVTVTMVGLVG